MHVCGKKTSMLFSGRQKGVVEVGTVRIFEMKNVNEEQ